jgi:DNA-binding PadR family transcriptional regulator
MTNFSESNPSVAFLDSLLDRLDPHQPARNEQLLRAQQACARWLALRRIHLWLTSLQIAGMADVSIETVRLLETGLANTGSLSESARQNLSRVLAPYENFAWTEQVIAIALGCSEALSPSVMEQVFDDLEMIASKTLAGAWPQIDVEPPAEPAEAGAVHDKGRLDLPLLGSEPGMFEVLNILADGDNHNYAIWDQLRERLVDIPLVQVGVLLNTMTKQGLVLAASTRLDGNLDSEPLLLYRLAPKGRQLYNAERTRRSIEHASHTEGQVKTSLPVSQIKGSRSTRTPGQ